MKDGIYRYSLRMHAPLGLRYGTLELVIMNGGAAGFLTMFTRRVAIDAGSCLGDVLRFSGRMETLLYPLPYTAEGTVTEEGVQVVFQTEKGRFRAEGAAETAEEGGEGKA